MGSASGELIDSPRTELQSWSINRYREVRIATENGDGWRVRPSYSGLRVYRSKSNENPAPATGKIAPSPGARPSVILSERLLTWPATHEKYSRGRRRRWGEMSEN